MKNCIRTFCIVIGGLLLAAPELHAQSYTIDWFKIAGGGGTSTNNLYAITGTLGQPEASLPMTGGNYYITGGFWSLITAVQTIGAPTLTITHSGNRIIVSWPSPAADWTLQQSSDLSAANWTASSFSIVNDGTNNFITLTSPAGNLFFRLNHQ